jgi:hypothetical protein
VEHPVQPLEAADALLLVQVDDRLGVRVRVVAVPLRLELGPDVHVVVDLAAERDPDSAVLVRHRLMAGRPQVDDRKPSVRERDPVLGGVPRASVVGAAVVDQLAHRRNELLVDCEAVARAEDARDAAHQTPRSGGL